jgi:hypothetical protein
VRLRLTPQDRNARYAAVALILLGAVGLGLIPVVCETSYWKRKELHELSFVAEAVRAYVHRTGHWPSSVAAMAPPECSKEECVLSVEPLDASGRRYELRSLGQGIEVRRYGFRHNPDGGSAYITEVVVPP